MDIKEKLTQVWKNCEAYDLSVIFESYMKSKNVRKYDGRRKDNSNSYLIGADSTNWNRVQCYFHKDDWKFGGDEDLGITLRKRAGDYFIIEKKGVRAFECDYRGIVHFEESLLNEIMEENKPLFDELLKIAN